MTSLANAFEPSSGADEGVQILGADPQDARVRGNPGIAGRGEEVGRLRRAHQRADDRVLSSPASDDEELQIAPMKSSIGIADSVSYFAVPREPSSSDTRAIVCSSGASTMLTKSKWPSVAHWALTVAPSCSISLLTSRMRAGLLRTVCTPSGVRVESMIQVGTGPPRWVRLGFYPILSVPAACCRSPM